jgi:hypothetical protein
MENSDDVDKELKINQLSFNLEFTLGLSDQIFYKIAEEKKKHNNQQNDNIDHNILTSVQYNQKKFI